MLVNSGEKELQPIRKNEEFRFACHPDVPCFTECCRDLNLMLTPYDLLRIRKALGMSSSDFIDKYTYLDFQKPSGFPVLFLRMRENSEKTCPFLSKEGCSIYKDRPSACRIYPVARATKFHPVHGVLLEAFYLIRESHCRGFEQKKSWTVSEWLDDQELGEYLAINDKWTEVVMHPSLKKGLSNQQRQFVYTLCYNMDALKKIVLSGRLNSIFDLSEDYISRIMENDFELLNFALKWLRFALLGQSDLKLKG